MLIDKDKTAFIFLVIFIIALTFVHNTLYLGILGAFFLVLSFKTAKKAFFAILFFNLGVSIGYVIESLILKREFLDYLLLLNLRVFDMTFAVLFISSRINLLKALSFSKSLQFLLSATLSQIDVFKKTYDDFILALKSRTVKKLGERRAKEFISNMFFYFYKKSIHNSKERTLALKSRGFFD